MWEELRLRPGTGVDAGDPTVGGGGEGGGSLHKPERKSPILLQVKEEGPSTDYMEQVGRKDRNNRGQIPHWL